MIYLLVDIKIRNGDYEYHSLATHAIKDKTNIQEFVEEQAKGFYEGEVDEQKEGYYFNAGEVCVWVYKFSLLSIEEYKTLNKYL